MAYWIEWWQALLFVLVVFVVLPRAWRASNSKIRNLPGPFIARFSKTYRIYMLAFGDGPERYRKLHEQYGPVVRIGPNHVSIASPKAIPIVYDGKNKFLKAPFYDVWKPIHHGHAVHLVVTPPHQSETRLLRQMLQGSMTNQSQRHVSVIQDNLDQFTRHMHDLSGQDVDFFVWSFYWAYDLTSTMLFGEPLGFMDQRSDIGGLAQGIIQLSRPAAILGAIPELIPWITGSPRFMSIASTWMGLIDPTQVMFKEVVKRVNEHDEKVHDCGHTVLCRILQQNKTSENQVGLDLVELALFEAFFAQAMEIAVSFRSILYVVVVHQAAYGRLKDIMQASLEPKQDPMIDRYLNAVIKEVLRIYPTITVHFERVVPEDGLNADGYFIPPGTIVSAAHAVTHHDTDVYGDDASDFRPERWLEADTERLKQMENNLMAFGKGSRACIGRDLGTLALRMLLKQILTNFHVRLANESVKPEIRSYWFIEQAPLNLRFESLSKS